MVAVAHDADPGAAREKLLKLSWWPVRIRWGAAPALLAVVWVAQTAGVVFPEWAFVLVGAFILIGNLGIYWQFSRPEHGQPRSTQACHQLVGWQAAIDGIAFWALTYLTGGVTGPLVVGVLLPVAYVSMLLPTRTAVAFCTALIAVLGSTAVAEGCGWLPHQSLCFRGVDIVPFPHPIRALSSFGFWAGTAYLTVGLMESAVSDMRQQIQATVRSTPRPKPECTKVP